MGDSLAFSQRSSLNAAEHSTAHKRASRTNWVKSYAAILVLISAVLAPVSIKAQPQKELKIQISLGHSAARRTPFLVIQLTA
jgi:hypothetical protein